ncbi:phage tail protein [Photobacterium minamisatsumaniensis]|uniref:phage tail protein n=1 Tax=Photobacterium minamisatsumaniensis TaxID=2910233 RepID=UPI003D0B658C
MEFIMGGTILFGGNFAPKDWAFCGGQLISISENQALFAILGTTWGGDGRTNFALPDLRSRVPSGPGKAPGITVETIEGRMFGNDLTQLSIKHMPNHSHTAQFSPSGGSPSLTATSQSEATAKMFVSDSDGATNQPTGNYLATTKDGRNDGDNIYNDSKGTSFLAEQAIDVEVNTTTTITGTGSTGGTVTVGVTGNGEKFSTIQPTLGINYIIAIQGTFPSRN